MVLGGSGEQALRTTAEQEESMGDVLIILWLPFTIAFMAVAFVLTLGAVAGTSAVESGSLNRAPRTGSDDGAR